MTASQYQSLVTAVVDGVPWGVFEDRTGGNPSGQVDKYFPGGMQKQKRRTGQREYDDVTVMRSWEDARDADLFRIGRNRVPYADVIINDQPLDPAGSPIGKPTTYTGTLQAISDAGSAANSTDGKSLTLTVVVLEVA